MEPDDEFSIPHSEYETLAYHIYREHARVRKYHFLHIRMFHLIDAGLGKLLV